MKRTSSGIAIALNTVLFAGCVGSGSRAHYTVQDSSGIEVVSTTQIAWTSDVAWSLASQPAVQIGAVDGDSIYQFFRIRGAVRLPNGTIVVADGGSSRIRFFDSRGTFLFATGGSGSGPGEYRYIGSIQRFRRDSLFVYDLPLRRISILDESGRYGRSVTLQQPGFAPIDNVFPLPDGRFGATVGWSSQDVPPSVGPGLHRITAPILAFSRDGATVDTVHTFPGQEISLTMDGDRPSYAQPPFSHTLAVHPDGNQLLVGLGDSYEVLVLDSAGAVKRILRGPTPDLTLKPSDVALFTNAILARMRPEARATAEAGWAKMHLPERKPAFERILVDPERNIWLGPTEIYGEPLGPWIIFDGHGRLLGTLAVPAKFHIQDIGVDYVLGVWQNEADVEFIRQYTLVK